MRLEQQRWLEAEVERLFAIADAARVLVDSLDRKARRTNICPACGHPPRWIGTSSHPDACAVSRLRARLATGNPVPLAQEEPAR